MKNLKELSFLVKSFIEPLSEGNYKIERFQGYLEAFERHGVAFEGRGLAFGTLYIYIPHLACALYSDDMVFWCREEKKNVEASEVQKAFRTAYIDGYKKGLAYFNEKYKPFLYTDAGGFFNKIEELYYKNGAKHGSCGWDYVKQQVPFLFDLEGLQEIGYYSALVACTNSLSDEFEIVNRDFGSNEPTKQKGFELDLTEEQLKKLHQLLIDEKFLAQNTKQEHFINAFNGKVLEEGFQQLVFKPISMLTIFVNAISIKYFLFIDKWVTTAIVFKSPNNKQLSNQYLQTSASDKAKSVNRLFENFLNEL